MSLLGRFWKTSISPEECGASLSGIHFKDWPEHFARFTNNWEIEIPKKAKKQYEIEAVILHSFIVLFIAMQTDNLTSDNDLKMRFTNSYHQETVNLLAHHGWVKSDFVAWNTIKVGRYDEYAHLYRVMLGVEKPKKGGGKQLGFAFVRHIFTKPTSGLQLKIGIPVQVWVASTIIELAKGLGEFKLKG